MGYHMSGIIGLIPARGGSKGILRKNIRNLAGKPLIAWTIDAAIQSGICDSLIVSTDDAEIARIATGLGAAVPFLRPKELATDTTPQISVVRHLIRWLAEKGNDPDYILLLQPTSPLRTSKDISEAVALAKNRHAASLVSLCESRDHPYLAKRIRSDGTIGDFIQTETRYTRRQDLPPAYALNGAIYLNTPKSLLDSGSFTPEGTVGYLMPQDRSLDIDTEWDFHLAELLLSNRER